MDIQYDKTRYVLDNHCHICFPQPIEDSYNDYKTLFDQLGIREAALLSCPASGHNDTSMDVLENMKVLYLKDRFPFPSYGYASFTQNWEDPQAYEQFAKTMLRMGFDGFKSMDGHPKQRKALGKGLNHQSFAGFFHVLNAAGVPMICHVGDPRPNWNLKTADESAIRLGRLYDDSFPSLDALYCEMEEVIASYPRIPFILAHFYFTSDNYSKACHLMETYPNLYFDLAPGGEMFVNFSIDIEKWKAFFLRYHNRIILGGDHYPAGYAKSRYQLARNFLEGTQPMEWKGSPVIPLHLPADVLEDIYWKNAHRLTGKPKPIDRKYAYDHCCYIQNYLGDQLSDLGKENLKVIKKHFSS